MANTQKSNIASDFATTMRSIDWRRPEDQFNGLHNMQFAVSQLLERLEAIEDRLAADDDELTSLRMVAIALAEHVIAGRTTEAKETAKLILSWYEEGDDDGDRGDDDGQAEGQATENSAADGDRTSHQTEAGEDRDRI